MGKQKRKTKLINCANCGVEFEKAISEINRIEKRNGKHFCSLKCSGTYYQGNLPKNFDVSILLQYSNNHRDEYTGFREFIRRAKNRNKLGDLTLHDLKSQWEKQKGVCPYTGIKLILPKSKNTCNIRELASLDRIDSSKLYERGNVVFVSTPINYMKGCMTEEDTTKFCKIIMEHWSKKE